MVKKKPTYKYRPHSKRKSVYQIEGIDRVSGFNVQKLIAILILAVGAVAAIIMISWAYFSPERITKMEMEKIARDYYENYRYAQLGGADGVKKYSEVGMQEVQLKDLLLYDNERNADSRQKFTAVNCDQEKTWVRFTPVEPFGSKDYKVVYNYICDF